MAAPYLRSARDLYSRAEGPEEAADEREGKQARSFGYYHRQALKTLAQYGSIAEDDIELRRIAIDASKRQGGDRDAVLARARKIYETLKSDRDTSVAHRGEQVTEAAKSGAFETPETVQATPEQRQAIQQGEPWQLSEEQARNQFSASGRVPKALALEFQRGSDMASFGHPEIDEEYKKFKAEKHLGQPEKEDTGIISTVAKTPVAKALAAPVKFALDYIGTGSRALIGAQTGALEAMREQGNLTRDTTLGEKAKIAGRALLGGAESAVAPFANVFGAGLHERSLAGELAEDKYALQREAIKQAKAEGGSREDVLQRARLIYQKLAQDSGVGEVVTAPIAATSALIPGLAAVPMVSELQKQASAKALEYPRATEFLSSVLQDPTNAVGGMPVVGAAKLVGKGVRAVPGGAAALEAVANVAKKATKNFRYMSHYDDLEKVLGPEAMQAIRVEGGDKARVVQQWFRDAGEKMQRVIAKFGVKDEAGNALVFDVLDGRRPVEDLMQLAKTQKDQRRLLTTVAEYKKMSGEIYDAAVNAGLRIREGESGALELARKVSNYVPRRVAEDTGAGVRFIDDSGKVHAPPAAAMAREEKLASKKYVKNAAEQWAVAASQDVHAAGKLGEIRAVHKALAERGLLHYGDAATAEVAGQQLAKASGLDYNVVTKAANPKTYEALRIASGDLGSTGPEAMVVPKALFDRIHTLTKIGEQDAAASIARSFNSEFVKPTYSMWRTNKTALRSASFYNTNFAGAVGLGVINHGIAAANPKLQKAAIRTAFKAAYGGADDALRTPYKLVSGESAPLYEILRIAKQYGVVGQGRERLAMDVTSLVRDRNPLKMVDRAMRYFLEAGPTIRGAKLSLGNTAAFGDDYQHLVTFFSTLTGLDQKSINEAVDLTAKLAGNYGRMTDFEQKWMKNIFAFYSWNRFILPRITKGIITDPQRFAAFQKTAKGLELMFGDQAPVFPSGISPGTQTKTAFTYPRHGLLGGNKYLEGDTAALYKNEGDFAMAAFESPLNALSTIASSTGVPLMPGAAALVQALTDVDMQTGEPIKGSFWEGIKTEAGESIPLISLWHMGKIYYDAGRYDLAAETWMRAKAGNDWLGLDRAAVAGYNALTGSNVEPQSIGLPIPGFTVSPQNAVRNMLKRKARAVEEMKQ